MASRILGSLFLWVAAVLVSGCAWSEESAHDEILFVRETARGAATYLMSGEGNEVRRLVNGTSPRWSPDGSRFAYVVDDQEKTRFCGTSVWVMNPETGARRRVANADGVCSLAWAPDGVRLAYSTLWQLSVVNAETGASEIVSLDPGAFGPMDWSRDGRELVVSSHLSSKILDTWTGRERNVVRTPLSGDARWSPDGDRIALARLGPELTRRFIVLVRPGGRDQVQVTHGAVDSWPAWSSDGKRIYFSRRPATRLGEDAGLQREEIYALDLETRSLRRLTRNELVDRSPDVHPEDRSLPPVPEPVVGDVVVPELVGRYVLLEDEKRRFRRLGLTLQPLDFLARDGVLAVVRKQVPRGGSRALRGSVVKVTGSDLGVLYSRGEFSARVWRAHPGCADPKQPRAEMYGDLVRRVLKRGMPRSQVVALLGTPDRSAREWSDWALGQWRLSHTQPIDCTYLRVEFDRAGRATRFHQWAR